MIFFKHFICVYKSGPPYTYIYVHIFCYEHIFADFNSYNFRRELEKAEVEGYNIGQYMKENENFFDRIESSDFSTTRKKRVVEASLTIWKRI